MVLVLIVVVSFVLTLFIERAEVELKSEGYYTQRAQLRLDAWSMLEVAVAVLADVKHIDGSLYAKAQGWGDPLEYAQIQPRPGLAVAFEFIDESGKMNLNEMGEDTLLILFSELGLDLDVALNLTDVLLDWIDADDARRVNGAESREYSSLDLETTPANQPLKSLLELRHLVGFKELFFDELGLPLPLFEELATAVSVHSTSRININSASPLALRALADFDELDMGLIDDYVEGLDGRKGTSDDNYFASPDDIASVIELPQGTPVGTDISILTIRVTVAEGLYRYTLVGTLNTTSEAPSNDALQGNIQYPFLFLELREEPGFNDALTSQPPTTT